MYAGGSTRHSSPPSLVRPQSTGTSLLSRSSSEDSVSSVEVVGSSNEQTVGRGMSSRSIGRGRGIAFRSQSTSLPVFLEGVGVGVGEEAGEEAGIWWSTHRK